MVISDLLVYAYMFLGVLLVFLANKILVIKFSVHEKEANYLASVLWPILLLILIIVLPCIKFKNWLETGQ